MAERAINLPPGFEIEEPSIGLPPGFEVEIESPRDESYLKQLWGSWMKGGMRLGQAVLEAPVHTARLISKLEPMSPEQMAEHKKVYPPSETAKIHEQWVKQHKAGQKRILENHPEWEYDPPENFLDLLTSPGKLSLAIAESTPLLVGAGITTAAGRPDLAVAMMYASEGQEAHDQAIDYGATKEQAESAYHIYGSVASVLEYMQLKGIIKIGKGAFTRVLNRTVQKTAGKTLTRQIVETAAKEALEESAQGAWGEATAKIVYDRPVEGGLTGFIDRRAQEGLLGATMGLIPGLGGSVTGVVGSKMTRSEKIQAVEALKSEIEQSDISEEGKNKLRTEFDDVIQAIGAGKFDVGDFVGRPEPKVAKVPGTDIEFDHVKAPITGAGGENVVEFFKDGKKVHQIRTKNAAQQREQAAGFNELLTKTTLIEPPTQALPTAQQDAAETISRSQAEYVARSEELRGLEYDELLERVQEGDELAAWRIQEMDAEEAVEQGLPTFEVLFEQMLEGDEVAKTALENGEYKGGRARQKALEGRTPVESMAEQAVEEARMSGEFEDLDVEIEGTMASVLNIETSKEHTGQARRFLQRLKDAGITEVWPDHPTAAAFGFWEKMHKEGLSADPSEFETYEDSMEELKKEKKARVDRTKAATNKQARNFATIKVHALAKMLGVSAKDRKRIQNDIIGKKSLKGATLEEVKRVEAYFVAEAKKRGLATSTGKELAAVVKSYATQKNVQEASGVQPVVWKRMLQTPGRIVSHFMYATKRIERLLEALDGFTEGPIYNSIWTPTHTQLVNSRASYTDRVGRFKEALIDIMTPELNTEVGMAEATEMIAAEETAAGKKARKLGKRAVRKLVGDSLWARHITGGREVVLEATDTNPELALTASERIGMYLALKNEDSRNHLFVGNLAVFTDPAVAALEVVQNMSTQEKQIGDWILNDLETNFDRANQAAVMGLGRALEQQDNYFPISIQDTSDLQKQDFLSMLEDKHTKQGFKVEPSETKERLKGAAQPLNLDSFSVYLNHLKRIEQFIHLAPVAKSVGNILNTREFRQAVNNATAGHGAGILDRWLKNAIRGHAVDPNTELPAKAMLWMRKKGVLFSLMRNVPSVARQFISGFNAAASHPTILAYAASNIAKSINPRYYNQLEKRMIKLSPEMKSRSFERYLANIKQQAQAAGVLTGKKEFSERALSWQHWADRRTVTVAWNSFYDAARESESVQKMFDLDGSDEAAVAYANKMIGRTQPMGDVEHLPDFFVGGPISRLLSTFQNQVNNNWNFWAHDIYGMRKAGKISNKMVVYRVLFSSILPAMMFGAISRGGPPDDWKDSLFDWAAYSISPIFLFGRMATDAVLGFAGGQTSVEDILPVSASKTVGAIVRGDPEKAALYGLKTVGGLTGRIPNQAIRTGSGIHDIVTGETDDLRRLIYSDWSLTRYGWPDDREESGYKPN